MMVQPSIVLIKQTERDLRGLDPFVRITALHSGGDDQTGVVRQIMKHLADTGAAGEILLITQIAFDRIAFFMRRSAWHVIYDEMPQIDYSRDFKLPANGHLVLDCFEARTYNATYSRLHVVDASKLQAISRNSGSDEAWAIIADFAGKLLSPYRETFVLSEQLAKFRANPLSNQKHSLTAFGLLQPTIFDGFASVTMMSACLEQTMCYRYWSQLGVKFSRHPMIKPRFEVHANGGLLDIYYASDRDWSKSLRDQQIDINGEKASVFDTVVVRAEMLLRDEPFVWMANKDVIKSPFTEGPNRRLPNSPHGLNEFKGYHNAVVLSALNPTPAHFAFLSEVAHISADEVKDSVYRQAVYQACGRTSLRDLASHERKKAVVMDNAAAEWLANVFPGARSFKLPGSDFSPSKQKVGRKPKHENSAARNAAHKIKRKAELIAGLDEVNRAGETKLLCKEGIRLSQNHYGSMFSTKMSSKAFAGTRDVSDTDLVAIMREQHARLIPGATTC